MAAMWVSDKARQIMVDVALIAKFLLFLVWQRMALLVFNRALRDNEKRLIR